jgi:hypothetical protein
MRSRILAPDRKGQHRTMLAHRLYPCQSQLQDMLWKWYNLMVRQGTPSREWESYTRNHTLNAVDSQKDSSFFQQAEPTYGFSLVSRMGLTSDISRASIEANMSRLPLRVVISRSQNSNGCDSPRFQTPTIWHISIPFLSDTATHSGHQNWAYNRAWAYAVAWVNGHKDDELEAVTVGRSRATRQCRTKERA